MAAALAEKFPEGGAAALTGDTKHIQAAVALKGGPEPSEPDVLRAVEAVRAQISEGCKLVGVEMALRLEDPETFELITEGTADLVLEDLDGSIVVIDWKSGRPENVTHPSANLQLHAYGLAAALARGESRYTVQIGHIVDGRFWWGEPWKVAGAGFWAYLDQVKSAAGKPIQARTGPHCGSCYQQKHCPAFLLPAYQGPTALEPFTREDGLTRDNLTMALLIIEAFKEAVQVGEDRIRNFIRENGPAVSGDMEYAPEMTNGRRSGPAVAELEKRGLHDLIREGRPYEVWRWRKRKGRAA